MSEMKFPEWLNKGLVQDVSRMTLEGKDWETICLMLDLSEDEKVVLLPVFQNPLAESKRKK